MPRPRTIRIRRKVYRVQFQRLMPHYLGKCEPPTSHKPRILIDPDLSPNQLLYAIIHEYMHADDWNASEKRIANRSRGLTRLLTSFGFRLVRRAKRKGRR